jgi:hypothetical protein
MTEFKLLENKWLVQKEEILLEQGRKHEHFQTARSVTQAVSPVLLQLGEAFVSPIEQCSVFLYLIWEDNRLLVSVVPIQNNGSFGDARICIEDETKARDLVAAYLCDFPDAVFSVRGGMPVRMKQSGVAQERFITLNNVLDGIKQGYPQFGVYVSTPMPINEKKS